MNKLVLLFILLISFAVAQGQEKPRVFVSGKGTLNVASQGAAVGGHHWAWGSSQATVDAHDESMEVFKDLQHDCPDVALTVKADSADYAVSLNRESKQKRGLLRTNSQIMVVNRAGDVVHTGATRSVASGAKDACGAIMSDWREHGRLDVPTPAPAAPPTSAPAAAAAEQKAAAADEPRTIVTPLASAPQQESLGDVARRVREQKLQQAQQQ